jgi:transcriptional regulator with XRE-family HTH domain
MEQKNISQYRLWKLSGVSQPQISRILAGQQPMLSTIQKLARGLGVSVAELITDDQPSPGPDTAA